MPVPAKLILLVDDSNDDAVLFRHALQRAGLDNPTQVVPDVDQAIAYLEGTGPFSDRTQYPMPAILIMDVRLPNKDGFELLRWLGQRPHLRSLHVVVLTGMGDMREVSKAYQMGANSFLTKPPRPDDLRNLAEGFAASWKME